MEELARIGVGIAATWRREASMIEFEIGKKGNAFRLACASRAGKTVELLHFLFLDDDVKLKKRDSFFSLPLFPTLRRSHRL